VIVFGITKAERERARAASSEPPINGADLVIVAHPIRYVRWLRDVRKNGASGHPFEEGRPAPRLYLVGAFFVGIFAFLAVIAIIAFS
jgi:hypothetical protein